MRRLAVWTDDVLVGHFEQRGESVIFTYASSDAPTVSLSLPKDRPHAPSAARNYLQNLLPEQPAALTAMREALGSRSTDAFDLLNSIDTTGGFIYTLSSDLPRRGSEPLVPLSDLDIEARMVECSSGRPFSPGPGLRFSLAGYQGKFTLARIGESWFAPTAGNPSTHIVKPYVNGIPDACLVESASMDLASACGLDVPEHGMITAGATTAYCISRFDRSGAGTPDCRRLHVEDLAQAMGIPPEEKYDPTVEDVVRTLRRADPTDELVYDWLSQYMFNAYSGNADGHAKNYSIIFGNSTPRIAPLYDSVMTSAWPRFDRGIGLSVNDVVYFPEYLAVQTWRDVARHSGLDEGRLVDTALSIAGNIDDALPEISRGLPDDLRNNVLTGARRATSAILSSDPGVHIGWSPVYPDDEPRDAPPPDFTPSEGGAVPMTSDRLFSLVSQHDNDLGRLSPPTEPPHDSHSAVARYTGKAGKH